MMIYKKVLVFGEVKDLTYVNIYNSDNEIDYQMNDKLKNYVNYIENQRY
jgi:hypothetical protein